MIAWLARALLFTLRVKIDQPENFDPNTNNIYAIWHGQQFMPIILFTKLIKIRRCGMISTSKDGDILAACMESLNYEIIRGSSSKNSARALLKMVRMVKAGCVMGFGIDGPKGPRGVIKPGIIFLAQKTGRPIVPISYTISKKYVFSKAWDKFEVPLPWQKIVFKFGEPIFIAKNITKEQIPELTQLLTNRMGRL